MLKSNFYTKLFAAALFIGMSFIASVVSADNIPGGTPEQWVATWGASPTETGNSLAQFQPNPGDIIPQSFNNKTIRMIVHTSLKGDMVRVHLRNAYPTGLQFFTFVPFPPFVIINTIPPSDSSVTIQKANIALRNSGAAIVDGSDQVLTFNGGQTSVTIPANGEVISDPVNLKVKFQSDLAISLYVNPSQSSQIYASKHLRAGQTSYIAGASGDFISDVTGSSFTGSTTQMFYVSEVDVLSKASTIVAFGASITEGFSADNPSTTLDKNTRYTDFLAKRLIDNNNPMGVVNAGIFGNQTLFDAPTIFVDLVFPSGPRMANIDPLAVTYSRFTKDALNVTGVKFVILNPTLNDVIVGAQGLHPKPTTCQLINGYKNMIALAHNQGVKIIGATITPRNDSVGAGAEGIRQSINTWILTGIITGTSTDTDGGCDGPSQDFVDGVIDFATAVADPSNPQMLNPLYNSGDGIHPNAAGYEAMSNSIDLNLFQ